MMRLRSEAVSFLNKILQLPLRVILKYIPIHHLSKSTNYMFKHLSRLIGLMGLLALMGFSAEAQTFPRMDKSPVDIAIYRIDGAPHLKVVYGRPAKKGRDIFGGLVPFDKVWRTGANEATEIKLYEEATVAGERLEAGTYSLFSIPGPSSWTIIFSHQTDIWGAYQYDEAQDALRIDLEPGASENLIEYFGITFQEVDGGVHLVLGWDGTVVEIPFEF